MAVLIVTDIFGFTDKLAAFSQLLNAELLTPYEHQNEHKSQYKNKTFEDQAHAYQSFLDECGHDKYFEQVLSKLQSGKIDSVIAFSAGACAAYRAICEYPIKHLIAFYPSQIRHHLNLKPQSPTTLIFPAHEPHFNVANTIKSVAQWPLVTCIQCNGEHGFMNPLSQGFNHNLAVQFEQVLTTHQLKDSKLLQQQLQSLTKPVNR